MPFRVEYAKTGRGGCKMAMCKHAMAKVPKGGIKIGDWVDIEKPGLSPFFSWRHWGCATPAYLASIMEDLEGNADNLDGFEELTDADQERVADALVSGKIAEEDKTVLTEEEQASYADYLADEQALKEMRREFKAEGKDFKLKEQRQALADKRLEAHKAGARAAKEAEKEQLKQEKAKAKAAKQTAMTTANTSKKRKLVKAEEDSDEPVKKEVKLEDVVKEEIKEEDSEAEEAGSSPPKKQRGGRKTKTKVNEDKPAAASRKPARAKKPVKTEPDTEDEEPSADEEEPKPAPKPKRKPARKAAKVESDAEEPAIPSSEPAVPKPKSRGRKKVVKKEPSISSEAELTDED